MARSSAWRRVRDCEIADTTPSKLGHCWVFRRTPQWAVKASFLRTPRGLNWGSRCRRSTGAIGVTPDVSAMTGTRSTRHSTRGSHSQQASSCAENGILRRSGGVSTRGMLQRRAHLKHEDVNWASPPPGPYSPCSLGCWVVGLLGANGPEAAWRSSHVSAWI